MSQQASLNDMVTTLKKILSIFGAIYPMPDSVPAFVATSYTIPASSSATITWTTGQAATTFIKTLYIDAATLTTYLWSLGSLGVASNQLEIMPPLQLPRASLISITIVNSDPSYSKTLSILIQGWANF
jgi:hypothetical protein